MKQRIILSTLLLLAVSPSLFAANHFKKMDECALIYSDAKAEAPIKLGLVIVI